MPVINKHRGEGAAKGDGFYVEPRGGHRRVFQETTQGAGEVGKVGIDWYYSQKVTQSVG